MPVVPRIDRPPTMPSRPLAVRLARISPPGHGDRHLEVAGVALIPRDLGDQLADQLAWCWIDRGLADRDRQARPGDHADAFAGDEDHAGAGVAAAHRDADPGAVRDVRVVAGILDHRGARLVAAQALLDQIEARPLAARQGDGDRVRKAPGQQREVGGLGRRGRAGAGRPTASELAFGLAGHACQLLSSTPAHMAASVAAWALLHHWPSTPARARAMLGHVQVDHPSYARFRQARRVRPRPGIARMRSPA